MSPLLERIDEHVRLGLCRFSGVDGGEPHQLLDLLFVGIFQQRLCAICEQHKARLVLHSATHNGHERIRIFIIGKDGSRGLHELIVRLQQHLRLVQVLIENQGAAIPDGDAHVVAGDLAHHQQEQGCLQQVIGQLGVHVYIINHAQERRLQGVVVGAPDISGLGELHGSFAACLRSRLCSGAFGAAVADGHYHDAVVLEFDDRILILLRTDCVILSRHGLCGYVDCRNMAAGYGRCAVCQFHKKNSFQTHG